jgi:hypothetical protein
MRRPILCIAIVSLCAGCPDAADDCNLNLDCAPDGACNGECVPGSLLGNPFLVWIGDTDHVPNRCPPQAQGQNVSWTSTPPASVCPACECQPSSGSCALPTIVTANASPCESTGAAVPFDPPNAWDGMCATPDSIPANALCDGAPCVQSITIGAPTPYNEQCEPYVVTTQTLPAQTKAFACWGPASGQCANQADTCAPSRPTQVPPGVWTYCILLEGSGNMCAAPYSATRAYASDYQDVNTCSPCACDAPVGGVCSSYVTDPAFERFVVRVARRARRRHGRSLRLQR